MKNFVSLYHPILDTTISVPPSAVGVHRYNGWRDETDEPMEDEETDLDFNLYNYQIKE